MAATTTKIELKGAKIVETPSSTGVAVSANRLETILAMLNTATKIDNNEFDLAVSATDVPVAMGNITTAKVLILIPDGPISVKINGESVAEQVNTALIWFGCAVTAITASNPSGTEVRNVLKYLASDE